MATSVGQISLDLVVNKKGFDKQMKGIGGLASKAGAALAGALDVKKLIDFSVQCISLGSDLAEVQNVVDSTFTTMSDKVNEFASTAIDKIGLSETVTKKYMGVLGAMSKSFGFSEQAAYNMAESVTTLAGDVASFYNISSDEAFTKLKSIWTGETESLKELGVVMTQSALDQFALQNGYGQTTAKMSEQEKVALRYAFVLEKLQTASGDFSRTSGGWANQTRVLSLRFEQLKATIGQGLINALLPVIKVLNALISKVQVAADVFKGLTEKIFGKAETSAQAVATSVEGIGDATSTAISGVGDAASAASDAAKKANNTGSIDELNIVSKDDTDTSAGSGSAGAGAIEGLSAAASEVSKDAKDKVETPMSKALDKVKQLCDNIGSSFKTGFLDQVKNVDMSKITDGLSGIGGSIKEIFSNQDVVNAALGFVTSYSEAVGANVGSLVAIGTNIATNIVTGIDGYLAENVEFMQGKFTSIFESGTALANISTEVSTFLTDLSSVLTSDAAIQITTDIATIFGNGFLNTVDLMGKFSADFLDMVVSPITDNADGIKEAIMNTLEPISTMTSSIRDLMTSTWEKIFETYETYVKPAFDNVKEGLTSIVDTLLDAYNTHIAPILQAFADKFASVVEEHIKPGVDKLIEAIGYVILKISEIWNDYLVPFINWLIENIIPVIAPILEAVGEAFNTVFATIGDVLGSIGDALTALIDFICDVFAGDWASAWNDIKDFFKSLWDIVTSIVTGAWDAISGIIKSVIDAIFTVIKSVFRAIKDFISTLFGKIKDGISDVWDKIGDALSDKLDAIKKGFTTVFQGIKDFIGDIFDGIWSKIKTVINSILTGIETMANGVIKGINKVIGALNTMRIDIPDWVTDLTGMKSIGFNIPTLSTISIPKLAQGGYVKANTPQLAMIGDNRTQGEIVAPEGKLLQMALQAAKMASDGGLSTELLQLIVKLLGDLYDAVLGLKLESTIEGRELKMLIDNEQGRAGFALSN